MHRIPHFWKGPIVEALSCRLDQLACTLCLEVGHRSASVEPICARPYSDYRTILAPSTIATNFLKATSRDRYLIPQSGAMIRRFGLTYSIARRMRTVGPRRAEKRAWPLKMLARPKMCPEGVRAINNRLLQDRWVSTSKNAARYQSAPRVSVCVCCAPLA
jgi:hypothetical protein